MNYLAHSFLSGQSQEIIVGNFIGDFVKGNQYTKYPKSIQTGILLHRSIDSFTDSSEIVKESKAIFQPLYGKYAGIIVDVLYDHFLSVQWQHYSNFSRETFIQHVYSSIKTYYPILPTRAHKLMPSIIFHNWMRYYASFYGIEKVLTRMTYRTSLPFHTQACIQTFREHYALLNSHFNVFFPNICSHIQS